MWGSSQNLYEDQESPKSIQDYQILCDKLWKELEGHRSDDSWIKTDVGIEGVDFYQKKVEGYALPMIRIDGILPASPEQVCKFNDIATDEERAIFDSQVKVMKTLEDINSDIKVFYAVYKGVFPVAERDFVAFRTNKRLPDGTWVSFGHSILHPDQPVQSNPVRAKGKVGMYCEPVPGKPFACMCRKFVLMDPMGNIPKWVITMAQTYAAKAHLILATVLKERYGDRIDTQQPVVVEEEEAEENFFDLIEFKDDDDFLIVDSSKQLTSLRSVDQQEIQPAPAPIAVVGQPALERSLSEVLKSIEASTEKLSKRLEKLEKDNKRHRGGIFISWGQLVLLLGWPLVLFGIYFWWRRRRLPSVKPIAN